MRESVCLSLNNKHYVMAVQIKYQWNSNVCRNTGVCDEM